MIFTSFHRCSVKVLLGLAILETTNKRDGYSAWMEVVEMMVNFLSHVCAFPACRKTRNSGHIAACRISTKGQFYTDCLVPFVALRIWNHTFRYRLWWAYRPEDVRRNLGCPKQAEGGGVLSGVVARWDEWNLGDVGGAAWVPSKLRSASRL